MPPSNSTTFSPSRSTITRRLRRGSSWSLIRKLGKRGADGLALCACDVRRDPGGDVPASPCAAVGDRFVSGGPHPGLQSLPDCCRGRAGRLCLGPRGTTDYAVRPFGALQAAWIRAVPGAATDGAGAVLVRAHV